MKISILAVVFASIISFSPVNAADTLFDDLGGREGIARISEAAIDLSLEDPRIKHTFDDINIKRLKRLLTDQLCELTGGPCKYEGRSMAETHATHHLTNAHFNALVEDLQIAMDRENIPFRVQNRLLAILAPMQRDIVTK
jgi:hemoglobin